VEALRDFVRTGKKLPMAKYFGPWPGWLCGGDLWGYGEDMPLVRRAARTLGVAESGDPESDG
jgi:hypothetical protein